jgi:hypothetical protein
MNHDDFTQDGAICTLAARKSEISHQCGQFPTSANLMYYHYISDFLDRVLACDDWERHKCRMHRLVDVVRDNPACEWMVILQVIRKLRALREPIIY